MALACNCCPAFLMGPAVPRSWREEVNCDRKFGRWRRLHLGARVSAASKGNGRDEVPAQELRPLFVLSPADHRSAIGIHVGLIFAITHAPPKAISPAYTICGSIAMSAEMRPTIAPSTDCTAFNRSFATL